MRVRSALLGMALVLAACGRQVDPATAVADAGQLMAEGKSGEARILLKNALAKAGALPDARVLLARIALDDGDARAAGDELSALDAATAATPAAVQVRAEVALALGQLDEARKLLDAAGSSLPELEQAFLRAALLRASGEPAEALLVLRRAQGQASGNERIAVEVAGTLAAMGDLSAAIAELDRHLALPEAGRADALRTRGALKMRQGSSEAAVADLRAALAAAPVTWPAVQHAATQLMIAEALLAGGKTAEVQKELEQLEKRWPGMMGVEVLRAQLALRDGRAREAVDRLDVLTKSAPGNARLQNLLVDALVRSGNLARATEILEQRVAAEKDPDAPARRALASLMMQQGRPDRVIDLLGNRDETAADVARDDDLLSSARLARRRASEAIATLTAELKTRPDDAALRARLAAAQIANGEPTAALSTLGPMPDRGWTAEQAAARASALLALNNDFEINRLVDRLLDPAAGADVATLVATADVMHQRRQEAAVSRLLDRAAQLDATNIEVQLRKANVAFEAGRHDEASVALKAIIDHDAGNITAQVAQARVAEARGDLDGARKLLRAVKSTEKGTIEAGLQLAALELRAGQARAAGAAVDALLASSTDASVAHTAGLLLVQHQHFEEARQRFRQAVDRDPKRADLWFSLGQAQLRLDDRPAARESFVRAAELQPEALRAVAAAVRLSIAMKDPATAQRVAAAATKAQSGSAGAWLLNAEAAWARGAFDAAQESYARSYALTPSAAAAVGEFRTRARRGTQRADAPLRSWLSRETKDLATRRVLADYLMTTGSEIEAKQQFELMLRQAPNDLAALNNLAWLLRDSDRTRAEKLALQASAIAPDNPAVADTLGMILVGSGRAAEAVDLLARAAAAAPQDRTLQFHHALALARSKRAAEAREILRKLLGDNMEFAGRAEARRLMEEL